MCAWLLFPQKYDVKILRWINFLPTWETNAGTQTNASAEQPHKLTYNHLHTRACTPTPWRHIAIAQNFIKHSHCLTLEMKIKSTGTSTSWTDSRSESRAWIGDLCGPQRSGGVGGGQVEHIVIASPPKVLRGAERQLSSDCDQLPAYLQTLTCVYVCLRFRASTQVCVYVNTLLLIFSLPAPIHFIHSFIWVVWRRCCCSGTPTHAHT